MQSSLLSEVRLVRSPVQWWLAACALVVLAALIAAVMATLVPRLSGSLIVTDPLRRVDAIVVVGGGSYADHALTPETAFRVLHGVLLLRGDFAPILILTGGTHRHTRIPDAEAMAKAALALGIDAAALIVDPMPSRTADQARSVADIARQRGIQSIALVTSPLHSYRATRAFRRAGLDVVSTPGVSDRQLASGAVVTSEGRRLGHLGLLRETVREYAALAFYRAKGWI